MVDEDHERARVLGDAPDDVARGARSPRRADRRRARRAARGAGLPTTARATSTRRRSRAPSVPTLASGSTSPRPTKASAREHVLAARRARRRASARGPARRCRDRQLLDGLLGLERAPQPPARAAEVRHREQVVAERARSARTPGATKPLSTLKNVVLPAPLGPIRPQVPPSKRTVMPSSGVTPPKRTVRSVDLDHARRSSAGRPRRVAPAIKPATACEVLRHLVRQPARRGQQHLQDADAEQDRQQVGGQAPVVEQTAGRSFMNMPATTAPQRL